MAMYGPGTRIIDRISELERYNHGNIRLMAYTVHHAVLHVEVNHPYEPPALLRFMLTQFISCASELQVVTFRMATAEERREFRSLVPEHLREYYSPRYQFDPIGVAPQFGQLVLEGREGQGMIWAGGLFIEQRTEDRYP